MYYIIALFAALLISMDMLVQKNYSSHFGESMRSSFRFNIAVGAATIVLFFFIGGMKLEFTPFSAMMAFLCALVVLLYVLLGFKLMKLGMVAVYSIFLMSGGMTVPYVYGLLFLDEEFSLLSMIGLVIIIAACVLSGGSIGRTDKRCLPLCVGVFFLNGATSVISKVHQVAEQYETVSSGGFVILTGFAKCVIGAAALLVMLVLGDKRQTESNEIRLSGRKSWIRFLITAAASAVIGGVSYFAQLICAENLPATMQYPFVTGGSIIFTALLGWLCLRERPSRRITLAILLCFAGICMFI